MVLENPVPAGQPVPAGRDLQLGLARGQRPHLRRRPVPPADLRPGRDGAGRGPPRPRARPQGPADRDRRVRPDARGSATTNGRPGRDHWPERDVDARLRRRDADRPGRRLDRLAAASAPRTARSPPTTSGPRCTATSGSTPTAPSPTTPAARCPSSPSATRSPSFSPPERTTSETSDGLSDGRDELSHRRPVHVTIHNLRPPLRKRRRPGPSRRAGGRKPSRCGPRGALDAHLMANDTIHPAFRGDSHVGTTFVHDAVPGQFRRLPATPHTPEHREKSGPRRGGHSAGLYPLWPQLITRLAGVALSERLVEPAGHKYWLKESARGTPWGSSI